MCLLPKIANCFATFSFMAPKAARRIMSSARMMSSGMAIHMFRIPSPVGAGRYSQSMKMAGMKARV
ncbi:hypothetical protein D3C72_2287340 [compost metagenome]